MQYVSHCHALGFALNSYGPEIDYNDMALLDYLRNWSISPYSKKYVIKGVEYFWASTELLIGELPYLNIKPRRLRELMLKYQQLGLIEACEKKYAMSKSLYRITGLHFVYANSTSHPTQKEVNERIDFLFPKRNRDSYKDQFYQYEDFNQLYTSENQSLAEKCQPQTLAENTSTYSETLAEKCLSVGGKMPTNNSIITELQIKNTNTNTCASETDKTSQGVIGLQSNSETQEQQPSNSQQKKIEQSQQEIFDLKEKEKKRTPPSSAAPPLVDQKPITEVAFEEIWNVYNKKIDKEAARRAYNKLCKEFKEDKSKSLADHLRSLYISVKAWSEYFVKSNTEKRFIPHLSTFLNNKRFEAQPEDVFGSNTEDKPEPQTIKKAYSASGNMYD